MSVTLAREHRIGRLDQIPRGEGRNFDLGGTIVAVFRTHRDEVFATQAACPHLQGPLADGMMGGTTITCPLHERVYDLRTGKVLVGECDIAVYPVQRLDDGTLVIALI